MGIPINNRDVEEWRPSDFIKHIVRRLAEKGIVYKAKYPQDAIVIGSVLKIYRKELKSSHLLLKFIDQVMDEYTLGSIQSLAFIRTLVLSDCERTSFKKRRKKQDSKGSQLEFYGPSRSETPELSDQVILWLQCLKATA